MINNTFSDYNPSDFDVMFDRDDLLGISLLGDDPIFQKSVMLKNMYDNVVDESVVDNKINTALSLLEEDDFDDEDDVDELDMIPDDSDVTIDGMDVEAEIEAAQDIFIGEADREYDIIDLVENL